MSRRDTVLAQMAQRQEQLRQAGKLATKEASSTNRLLAALPRAEYQRLFPGLELVTLNFGDVLHEPDVPLQYVYFPIDCVVALLATGKGHPDLQIGLVGHEGMVGIPLGLGIPVSSRRAVVQGTGTAMRMESTLFSGKCLQSELLRQALFRYKHALTGQIAQSAVCSHFHSVQERLARYLLMTGDCARSAEIRLNQEFIAHMLGVRRVGISNAASDLQKRKLVKCGRGKITILDRNGLSEASCECYKVIKRINDTAYADG
jgi:Crp-like helix-turn-helix domain